MTEPSCDWPDSAMSKPSAMDALITGCTKDVRRASHRASFCNDGRTPLSRNAISVGLIRPGSAIASRVTSKVTRVPSGSPILLRSKSSCPSSVTTYAPDGVLRSMRPVPVSPKAHKASRWIWISTMFPFSTSAARRSPGASSRQISGKRITRCPQQTARFVQG